MFVNGLGQNEYQQKLQNHGKQKKDMGNTFTEEAKLTQCNTTPKKTSGGTETKVVSAPLVLPVVISCGFQE